MECRSAFLVHAQRGVDIEIGQGNRAANPFPCHVDNTIGLLRESNREDYAARLPYENQLSGLGERGLGGWSRRGRGRDRGGWLGLFDDLGSWLLENHDGSRLLDDNYWCRGEEKWEGRSYSTRFQKQPLGHRQALLGDGINHGADVEVARDSSEVGKVKAKPGNGLQQLLHGQGRKATYPEGAGGRAIRRYDHLKIRGIRTD